MSDSKNRADSTSAYADNPKFLELLREGGSLGEKPPKSAKSPKDKKSKIKSKKSGSKKTSAKRAGKGAKPLPVEEQLETVAPIASTSDSETKPHQPEMPNAAVEARTEEAATELDPTSQDVEVATTELASDPDENAATITEPAIETPTAESAVETSALNEEEHPALESENTVESEPTAAVEETPPEDKGATTDQETIAAEAPSKFLFSDLPLVRAVQLAVQESGYIEPTDIQRQIIPLMLDSRDVLAQSQTGSGKTAAFALPVLSNLSSKERSTQVLVLAPTRELATQVAKSFETYGAHLNKLSVLAIYGGADYTAQLRGLKRGAQIVVGTPGRVIDHIKRGTLKLDQIKSLVLDEADEMLNMGFVEDVEFILSQTPEEKQTALFSATMPGPIREIADRHLKDPATITIRQKTLTAESIAQKCVFVEERNKRELLARLLEVEDTDGIIVFTKTKDSTVHVSEHLVGLGLRAAALNGDLPQARRQRTVDQLASGKLDILVATDVAARGLDVQRISHVFNFDLPHDGESYVHRIGRTGRAGKEGVAYIFLTPRQRGKLRIIERVTKKRIEVIDAPSSHELNAKRIERFEKDVLKAMPVPDAELYAGILKDLSEKSGKPLLEIAATLAHLSRGGRPLLSKDLPNRPERSMRPEAGKRGKRGGEFRTQPKPARGMRRYWIGVGHDDGVRPNNIVGAVANEAGISGKEIGPINIRDDFSTIDLPASLSQEAMDVLRNAWVSGKQLRIRPYSMSAPSADRGGKRRFAKSSPNPKSKDGRRGKRSFSDNAEGKKEGFKDKFKKPKKFTKKRSAKPIGGKRKSKQS